MKRLFFILVATVTSLSSAQSLDGAWKQQTLSEDGKSITNVVIFSNGYQVSTNYQTETGALISTNGGAYTLDGNTITEQIEFDTENPQRVGTQVSFDINITEESLSIKNSDRRWKRIDSGAPGDLKGAWLMSGRKRNGEIQTRDTSRPRKTMKILSGTRFQWIAYNTETKEFKGTGGGIYTTLNGAYTENIEFFSRDNSRVGASLRFTYELIDGAWHHSGLSSKGSPIYEIWSLRK